jgi:hypothetical protein
MRDYFCSAVTPYSPKYGGFGTPMHHLKDKNHSETVANAAEIIELATVSTQIRAKPAKISRFSR